MNHNDHTGKPTILDVRTPLEFSEGHYPGAVNIPVDELPLRLREVKAMNQPIIAYCRSGARSGMAVSLLRQKGIAEAINGGGLEEMMARLKQTG